MVRQGATLTYHYHDSRRGPLQEQPELPDSYKPITYFPSRFLRAGCVARRPQGRGRNTVARGSKFGAMTYVVRDTRQGWEDGRRPAWSGTAEVGCVKKSVVFANTAGMRDNLSRYTKSSQEVMFMAGGTVTAQRAYLRLNDGTTVDGNVRVVSVGLGTLNPTGWDADKGLAIADKLENCLTKTMYAFEGVTTTQYTSV